MSAIVESIAVKRAPCARSHTCGASKEDALQDACLLLSIHRKYTVRLYKVWAYEENVLFDRTSNNAYLRPPRARHNLENRPCACTKHRFTTKRVVRHTSTKAPLRLPRASHDLENRPYACTKHRFTTKRVVGQMLETLRPQGPPATPKGIARVRRWAVPLHETLIFNDTCCWTAP